MSKVTEKNTKKEILEALREAEAELKERREATTTTADKVEKKRKEAVKEVAKKVAEEEILNPVVIEKYKSLKEANDMLEKELEETHEIKKTVDTLEALYVVHAKKETELKEEYAGLKANLEKDHQARKAAMIEEYKEEEMLRRKAIADLKEEYAEEKKSLELARKREKEEYEYNLKRARSIENDNWEDEKTAREKELADREAAVVKREVAVNDLEEQLEESNNKVAMMEAAMKTKIEEAFKDGQAKAEKVCAIKEASVKKDAEWQQKIADEKIASLEKASSSKDYEIESLKEKLDEAYGRIQQMAIEQSKSSTPRVVEKQS